MRQTMSRFSLTDLVLVAAASLAQGQTADDRAAHHSGGQAAAQASSPSMTPPKAGKPMAGPMAAGGIPGAMGGGMEMPFEHVEGRIAYLKTELKITDAQAAPCNAFADAGRRRRDEGHARGDGQGRLPGSLPERLAARQKMMSAHIGMLERMEAGAKPLYAVLSGGTADAARPNDGELDGDDVSHAMQ